MADTDRSGLTWNGTKFSDGTHLLWETHGRSLRLWRPSSDDDDDEAPMDARHRSAPFSGKRLPGASKGISISIAFSRWLPPKVVVIAEPVTVGSIMRKLIAAFGTKIRAQDYATPETNGERAFWDRKLVGNTPDSFKKAIRTYGNLMGDHTGFNGLQRTRKVGEYVLADMDS
jgi:hypothetical protein